MLSGQCRALAGNRSTTAPTPQVDAALQFGEDAEPRDRELEAQEAEESAAAPSEE